MEGVTYLLDVGVLIALTDPGHLHHRPARLWFAGVERWATCPMTEASFVRLALNEALTGRKPSRTAVLAVLKGLRAWPGHVFLVDDTSLADPLIDLSGLMGHRQVTDLHLVNLAARHGAVLATLDHRIASGLMPGDQRIIHNVLA